MIKASIDRPKLERSLKRFAKEFGDTNAQALCRWGVQTCRELAGSSQAFGRTAEAKRKQWNSIEAGMRSVLTVVTSTDRRKSRVIADVSAAHDWIDSHQNKKGRTKTLSANERAFITQKTFDATLKERRKLAGMAKGGWIGAGQEIAMAQKGTDRVAIGKNFLGYAQRHAGFGDAKKPRAGWSSKAEITNRTRHSGSQYVLSTSESARAIQWGLKKTVQWYRAALRRQDQKQKA